MKITWEPGLNLRESRVIGRHRAEIVRYDRGNCMKERLHIAQVIIDTRAYQPGKGKRLIESRAAIMTSLFFGNMKVEHYEGNRRDQDQEDESGVCTTIERNHLHRSLSPPAETVLRALTGERLNSRQIRSISGDAGRTNRDACGRLVTCGSVLSAAFVGDQLKKTRTDLLGH